MRQVCKQSHNQFYEPSPEIRLCNYQVHQKFQLFQFRWRRPLQQVYILLGPRQFHGLLPHPEETSIPSTTLDSTNETEKCNDEPSGENGTTNETVFTTEPKANTNLTTTEVETTAGKIGNSERQTILTEKEIGSDQELTQKPSSTSTSGEKQVETSVTTTNGFCRKFLRNHISFVLTLILSMP